MFSLAIERQGARLYAYLHGLLPLRPEYNQRPCVLICPGGGYRNLSDREGDPVVFACLAQGYQVFLLEYSVGDRARDYQPLKELSKAVVTIRENSITWGVDPGKIAVLGFSAGGHLACSLGVLRDTPAIAEDYEHNRPDALILCYPVITGGAFAHAGSFERLTGKERCADWEAFSLERFVTSDTPPCFLWHTVEDAVVPVQNTLLMLDALQRVGVPYECHLYPKGAHGLSTCLGEVARPDTVPDPHVATWMPLCIQWLNDLFDFTQ